MTVKSWELFLCKTEFNVMEDMKTFEMLQVKKMEVMRGG